MRHSERIMTPAAIEPAIRAAGDWTLRPTRVQPDPGPEHRPEAADFVMSMGIERTPKGRLWVGWFGGDDSRDAYILLAKSDDDGRTWSDPLFMVDPEPSPNGLRQRALVGNLWTDPQGRLWMFFDKSLRFFDGRAGVWATVCENPDDARPTWSEPKRVAHGATLNKPTVLANGDWLLPVSLWQREYMRADFPAKDELFRELDPDRMANVYVSKDQGGSWERRGGVLAVQRQFDEQMILERRDGSLLMFLRTDYGIAETESFDQGRSWTAPARSTLEHVSARIFVRRLASGRVLLVKHGELHRKPAARSHLTAYLSDDDGATWRGGLLLDERVGVSYPDGFQAPDGRIVVAYDRLRTDGEILMAVFTEDDVLAGRDVSVRVALRMPVKRTQSVRDRS